MGCGNSKVEPESTQVQSRSVRWATSSPLADSQKTMTGPYQSTMRKMSSRIGLRYEKYQLGEDQTSPSTLEASPSHARSSQPVPLPSAAPEETDEETDKRVSAFLRVRATVIEPPPLPPTPPLRATGGTSRCSFTPPPSPHQHHTQRTSMTVQHTSAPPTVQSGTLAPPAPHSVGGENSEYDEDLGVPEFTSAKRGRVEMWLYLLPMLEEDKDDIEVRSIHSDPDVISMDDPSAIVYLDSATARLSLNSDSDNTGFTPLRTHRDLQLLQLVLGYEESEPSTVAGLSRKDSGMGYLSTAQITCVTKSSNALGGDSVTGGLMSVGSNVSGSAGSNSGYNQTPPKPQRQPRANRTKQVTQPGGIVGCANHEGPEALLFLESDQIDETKPMKLSGRLVLS
eukprot:PhF_6_TR7283/c0_g1_i2/m.10881